MEDHALDGDFWFEHFDEVPCDGFTFAVLIGCEVEFVGVLEEFLEFGDLFLLAGVHPVVGVKAVVHVDGELAVGAFFHVGREF